MSTTDNPDVLSLYRDDNEDIQEFDIILESLAVRNTVNICANPDTIIPVDDARRYCAGYFGRKIEVYWSKVIYNDKSGSEIYNRVFKTIHNVPKERFFNDR